MQWFLVGHVQIIDFVNALSIVEPTPLKKKLSHLRVPKILLEREDIPENEGVDIGMWSRGGGGVGGWGTVTFLLLYNSIAFPVCGEK